MKIYCQLSDCMFSNAYVPDGIRVVNHVVEVDDETADLLVHSSGSIFAFAPWQGESAVATEYEPSDAPASDFEGDTQPPKYDPETAETPGTSSDAPAAPGQS